MVLFIKKSDWNEAFASQSVSDTECWLCFDLKESDNVITRLILSSVETATVGAFFCVSDWLVPTYVSWASNYLRVCRSWISLLLWVIAPDAYIILVLTRRQTTLQGTNFHVVFAFVGSFSLTCCCLLTNDLFQKIPAYGKNIHVGHAPSNRTRG